MAITKINFNEINNASETEDVININDRVFLKQETILPNNPPPTEFDGAIWVDPNTNNLKVKINAVIYELSPQTDFNNISIDAPYTFPLNGNVGIVNNLTISGTGTTVNFRSSSTGGAQWSILEVKGDLTINSGCTLNLVRTPLIVRGSILGTGIISSPNGVNGGAGGTGGVGGTGGAGRGSSEGYSPFTLIPYNGAPGSLSPNLSQPGGPTSGGSSNSLPVEYGVSSGGGGPGGQGGRGGGGGAGFNLKTIGGLYFSGTGGTSTFPGGASTSHAGNFSLIAAGGGGGGGAGGGVTTSPNGGLGITAPSGSSGTSVGSLNVPYTGIGNPTSPPSLGTPGGPTAGTFGGAGGRGSPLSDNSILYPGSPGGTGGNGGAGGGTGGAHISILCAGTVSSSLTIRPGKGGLTGGSTSLPRAQTGSLWLFTPTGSESVPGIDLNGASGIPIGLSGNSNRFALSNSSALTDFLTGILYEASGSTPAKNKIAITYP